MANNLREIILAGTTNGSGALTILSDARVTGIIRRVQSIRSGGDSGSLIEVFMEGIGDAPDVSVIDLAAGNTDLSHNPKLATHANDGSAISGGYTDVIAFNQRLKAVVASGGDTLPFEFRVLVEELTPSIS